MIEWIKTIIQAIGYPGIVLLMAIENIFPPIPSELIIPFAGFVSEQGKLSFWGVVLSGTCGSVLGTIPLYVIGYKIGEENLEEWVNCYGHWLMLKNRDVKRAQRWFNRHDALAVLFCRIIPGLRSLISIPAGIERMNVVIFILLSFLGTGVWVGILAYLGQVLGQNYDKVAHYTGPAGYIVMGVLLLGYIVYLIRRYGSN